MAARKGRRAAAATKLGGIDFSMESLLRPKDTTTGNKRSRTAKGPELPMEVIPGIDGETPEGARIQTGGPIHCHLPMDYIRDGATLTAKLAVKVAVYCRHESPNAALTRAGIKYELVKKRPDAKSVQRGIDRGVYRRYLRREKDGAPQIIGFQIGMGADWPFDHLTMKAAYIPMEILSVMNGVAKAAATSAQSLGEFLKQLVKSEGADVLDPIDDELEPIDGEDTDDEATG